MRRNGLERPWHVQQMVSWFSFLAFVAIYYAVISPKLTPQLTLVLNIGYGTLAATTLVAGFCCTVLNPVERCGDAELEARVQSKAYDFSRYPKLCPVCVIHTPMDTKHCRICKKCVSGFDHHCNWLNNCLGTRNYKVFVLTLFSLEALIGMHFGAGVQVAMDELRNIETTKDAVLVSICLVSVVAAGMIVLSNGSLLIFHGWLRCRDLTTQEFLRQRKVRRRVKPLRKQVRVSGSYLDHESVSVSHKLNSLELSTSQQKPDTHVPEIAKNDEILKE